METEIQIAGITVTVAIVEEWDELDGPHLEVRQTFSSLVEGIRKEWSRSQVCGYDLESAQLEYSRLVERFNRLSTK